MTNPFPLVVLFQSDPATAGNIRRRFGGGGQSGSGVRFGGSGPRLNAEPDGKSYTIQVRDSNVFELVKNVLREHGASANAWVSIDAGAGPQWVPLSKFIQG